MGNGQPLEAQPAGEPVEAMVDGNRLRLIDSGAERLRALLELIDGASSSIRMLFYMFEADPAGERVRDALVAAARRGVKVKLLLDGFGSANVTPAFFADIDAAGGSLCLFHPKYGRRYLLRNHQKLVIVDGESDGGRAIVGGANVQQTYLNDGDPRHWRDVWLMIEGPGVAEPSAYFDALYRWTTTKGAKLRSLRRLISRHSRSRGSLQWKYSGPLNLRNPWPRAFARDLNHARRVDIVSAYFSPPRFVLRRIARAASRGQARVITAAKSDNNATIAAARHTYSRLLRRGVEMYEYRPARLHTKLLLVDDIVYVGSANLDFRSIYLNLEIMLRIDNPFFAERIRRWFEAELEACERITPQLHRSRANFWRRLKWMLSHWLVTTMDYTVTRRLNFGPEA
jgi:cardiolipin synthase